MADEGYVNLTTENGIARITFYHPKGNSLPSELLEELRNKISEASSDGSAGVILLSSEGAETFCAGASFTELASLRDEEKAKRFFMGFGEVIYAMISSPLPVVTKAEGKAVGGGVGIIAASDYVIAQESSAIRLSELALGIGPFVIEPVVSRKTGRSFFTAATLDTGWRRAIEAKEAGLYNKVYKTSKEAAEKAEELAGRLAAYSMDAKNEIKKLLWEDKYEIYKIMKIRAAISGRLALSEVTQNYIKEFLNKKGK